MNNKNEKMPRLASWIIRLSSMEYHKHQALGDLEELYYQMIAEAGIKQANKWYRRQVFKSVPHLIHNLLYWSFTMLKSIFKITLRNLKKNKGYSFINIAGLAVGIACTFLILLWVRFELSYDRFHKNGHELHKVVFTNEANDFYGDYVPGPMAEFLENEYPEIIHATNLGGIELKLSNGNKSFSGSGFFVHPSFFEMFTFPFKTGDSKTCFDNLLSIVITEEMADRLFGKSGIIGETVKIDDRVDLTITGVIENIPQNSSITFEILLPFGLAPRHQKVWDNKAVQAFILIQKGIPYKEVSEKIIDVYNDQNPGTYKNNFFLQPLTDVHLHNLSGGGLITYVYIFSAMAAVILLLACINFMNLSTARSEKRFKEIGVKKVSGASRMQLVLQFLSESVIFSFIALILSLILVYMLLPSVNSLIGKRLELNFTSETIFLLVGITFLTGIFSGSYPAFFLTSFNVVSLLNRQFFLNSLFRRKNSDNTTGNFKNILFRKVLVVFQFSVSILFLICAVVILKQLDFIREKDLGFNKDDVIMVSLERSLHQNYQSFKQELLKNSRIENVALSTYGLDRWKSSAGIGWPGKLPDQIFDIGFNWVDEDYLKTLQMEMAEGRFFSGEFQTDYTDAFVVNEAAVKAMGLKEPVGKRITRMPDSRYEDSGVIIGVIKDYHTESLRGSIRPFLLMLSDNGKYLNVRIKPGNISGTISYIENTIKKMSSSHIFEYTFLDEQINNLYRIEYMTGKIVTYVTFLALFISCLGLLGLAAYSVEQRTKEIGIRKVLGSSSSKIFLLLTKDFVKWVIVANIIAWPVAWYAMNRWLQNFAFKTPLSWYVFIFAGFTVLVVALLTVSYQSIRATGKNPVYSLRYE